MGKRIYLFDNIRAILIFLVVFGHFIEPLIISNRSILIIYAIIYSFHMPLFALVSGYFSKLPTKKEIFNLLKIFFVFEIIYGITSGLLLLLFSNNMEVFFSSASSTGLISMIINLFSPIWLLWYLLALIFWKLLLVIFGKNKKMIIVALIITILIGFVELNGRFLTYQRMFGMFPFFLIGYYANYDILLKLKASRYSILNLILSIILLIITVPKVIGVDVQLFYYADSYSQFNLEAIMIVIYRIGILLTALSVCLSIVCYMPNKKLFFSELGSNTIGIYLGHGLLFLLLMGLGLFEYILRFNPVIIVLIMLVLSYSVMIIFNRSYVIEFINKITFNERKN